MSYNKNPEAYFLGERKRQALATEIFFFLILIIIRKHSIFTCMYKLMSFQIPYTVKNPSTDFTWMDVSETKKTKTVMLFLRQR